MNGRRLSTLLSLVLIGGCSTSMYRTTYEFTPPRDRIGHACSTQCSATRDACRGDADSLAKTQYSQCEAQAQQDYNTCLSTVNDPKQRNVCLLQQCDSHGDYSRCDVDYRSCYSGCGGKVAAQKTCVFNCSKTDSAGGS